MNNKILTLLGFAAKAGKLSYGFDSSLNSIIFGKSKLIITSGNISKKTLKEIVFFANKKGINHILLEGIETKTLSNAVGRNCGVISVNDTGFANACCNAFNEGGNANDQQI